MAADFVTAVHNLRVSSDPTKQYNESKYDCAAFPVFALGPQVSESVLQQAAKLFNHQAQTEIVFDDADFEALGIAATVPMSWNMHEQSAPDAVQWYLENFNKQGSGTPDRLQWFPYGFVRIASTDWEETGAVLVFYNFWNDDGQFLKDQPIPVVAFVIAAKHVGSVLITLRLGNEDIEDVKDAYSTS